MTARCPPLHCFLCRCNGFFNPIHSGSLACPAPRKRRYIFFRKCRSENIAAHTDNCARIELRADCCFRMIAHRQSDKLQARIHLPAGKCNLDRTVIIFKIARIGSAPRLTQDPMYECPRNPECCLLEYPWIIDPSISPRLCTPVQRSYFRKFFAPAFNIEF